MVKIRLDRIAHASFSGGIGKHGTTYSETQIVAEQIIGLKGKGLIEVRWTDPHLNSNLPRIIRVHKTELIGRIT